MHPIPSANNEFPLVYIDRILEISVPLKVNGVVTWEENNTGCFRTSYTSAVLDKIPDRCRNDFQKIIRRLALWDNDVSNLCDVDWSLDGFHSSSSLQNLEI